MTETIAQTPHLVCVPPKMASKFWPAVMPMVEEGYRANDLFLPVNIEKDLIDGLKLLWLACDGGHILAVMVTELELRPSGKICYLGATCGRDLRSWKNLQQKIENYAKSEGCSKLVIEGRKGWIRALPGFCEVRSTIEKQL